MRSNENEAKKNIVPDERAFRLLEALSSVDEELIDRSEQATVADGAAKVGEGRENRKVLRFADFRRYAVKYGRSWAAVLCFAVVGFMTWSGYRFVSNFGMGKMESAVDNAASGGMFYDGEAETATSSSSVALTEGVRQESAEEQKPDPNPETDENNFDMATNYLESNEKGVGTDEIQVSGGTESVQVTGAKELMSLEQAREIEGMGDYIPTNIPAGYVFESAEYVEETSALNVCWTKGVDSVFWHVEVVGDAYSLNMVDLAAEETYNVYLYEIPLADTVPEEYREIFSEPVCRAEDFCLEFVEKRMIFRGTDAGDTTTHRGNFAVLYPDNYLVRFHGRGTAEEIYEMFQGLN